MGKWQELAELALSQHGVVSRSQAAKMGIGAATLHRRVQEQGWRRAYPGVFVMPGAEASFAQRAQAALLVAGPDAVICRRSAAHFLGLLPQPDVIEMFIPLHEKSRHFAGVRCCRTGTLAPRDLTTVRGIRCTTGTRTVIDLAAVVEPLQLRKTLIDARQRRLLNLDQLKGRMAHLGPVRGIGVLKRQLWELEDDRCDSILEDRVRRLLRAAGLPRPHPEPLPVQTAKRVLTVDIAWQRLRVGIEVDGHAYHSSRSDLDRDHRRLNALTLQGWKILRVGWDRVEEDSETFVAEVRSLLRKV